MQKLIPNIEEHLTNVTIDLARDWLAHNLFEGQRPVRLWHARFLQKLMEAGKFRRGAKIEFALLGTNYHLIDGQHTLTGIVLANQPQDLFVCFRRVQSFDEIGRLYGTFGRELGRTPADVFAGLGLAQQLKFTDRQLNMLHGAVRLLENGFRIISVNTDVRVARDASFIGEAIVAKWQASAHLYCNALDLAPKLSQAPLKHRSVVAVALATLGTAVDEETRKKAITFWEEALMNDGLRRGHPGKTLHEWVTRGIVPTDALTIARYVASAWNAYYEGRQIEALFASGAGYAGLRLRGTSFYASAQRKSKGDDEPSMPAGAPDDPKPLPLAAQERAP